MLDRNMNFEDEIEVCEGVFQLQNEYFKFVRSENYNYIFSKENGRFVRWGKTEEDDPLVAPFPEILDIEVSEICNGVPALNGIESPCKMCYKANTKHGRNMSFEDFKKIIDKMTFITQVAFGADAKAESNPDLFKMMEYSKSIGIIPNITVANISDEVADKLSIICGAVAVSRYENKEICYNSIKKLTDRGMSQINMHMLVSMETKDQIYETLKDIKNDERLSKLNAIVFLSLKKVGRGTTYNTLPQSEFTEIVTYAMNQGINIGFDSCSQHKFKQAIKGRKDYDTLIAMTDPCESTCFSSYINVKGEMYSCSFCENSPSFPKGLDVVNCEDFIKDIWNAPETIEWRNNLLSLREKGIFGCPVYQI